MSYWDKEIPFATLVGKTLTAIRKVDDDELYFETAEGQTFKLYHSQDCCESVTIESITGDFDDLVGTPILVAEEATSEENPEDANAELIEYQDSFTWTFYKLATVKGWVDIRWYGSSNGYYGESVDFVEV